MNKQFNEIRGELKTKLDERGPINNPDPAVTKKMDDIEKQITKVQDQKEALHNKMTAVRTQGRSQLNKGGDEQQNIREQLSLLRLRKGPLRQQVAQLDAEHTKLQAEVKGARDEAERLKTKLPKEKKGVLTAEGLEEKIEEHKKKIKGCNRDQETLAAYWGKELKQMEKSREGLETYWRLVDKLFHAQTSEKTVGKKLKETTATSSDIESKMAVLEGSYNPVDPSVAKDARKKIDDEADKIYSQIQEQTKKIEKLRMEKQAVRESVRISKEEVGTSDLMTSIREDTQKRDEIWEKLKEVRTKIPNKTVNYPKELHSDLIGPKGATINGLQNDFGVMLNVNQEQSNITLRGSEEDMEQCEEAITQLMKNARDNRASHVLEFDVAIRRELIGPQGTNIRQMEEASGARINVDSQGNTVTITGNAERVELGKQIVEEFLDTTCRFSLPFDQTLSEMLVGRQGKTVRKITEDTGCKNISIRNGTIEILGSKESANMAKTIYEEMIADYVTVQMKITSDMIAVVVGKGGVTIQKIEADTRCSLTVGRGPQSAGDRGGRGGRGGRGAPVNRTIANVPVTIQGSSQSVRAAKAMIDKLLIENATESEKVMYDPALRYFLISPDQNDPDVICPLERIKRDSGCYRLDAPRDENFVAVFGKRETLDVAVKMLNTILEGSDRKSKQVSFEPVLFGALAMRSESSPIALLDQIRKDTGCDSLNANRQSSIVTIVGEAEKVELAEAQMLEALERMQADVISIDLPSDRVIPALIGTGGQTINRIRQDTECEMNLDRENLVARVYGLSAEGRAAAEAEINSIIQQFTSPA